MNYNYNFKFQQLTPRPFDHFEAFMDYERNRNQYHREYPCTFCSGYGYIRKFEDCDVIEGYKHAPWHKCNHCHTTGELDLAFYVDLYVQIIDKWNTKLRVQTLKLVEQQNLAWKAEDYLNPGELKRLKEIL